ncbi:MAG: YiiD C-terminal domain-containing protein [Methanosarcinaceae archaeon]
MNVEDIPLVKYLGIIRNSEGKLELPFQQKIENFFQTQHAGSQFTLAETASIDYLKSTFPELIEKAIPVFRGSELKFKQLSENTIVATASIDDDLKTKFEKQLEKKSRANITVDIKLIDSDRVVTFVGKFNWFIQLT